MELNTKWILWYHSIKDGHGKNHHIQSFLRFQI